MLLNDLYKIQSITGTENQIQATVELMAEHAIFKGHFPGQPVLPGVCMMEMIAEVTGKYLQKHFQIAGAPMIKFLLMIDPRKNPILSLEIKYHTESEYLITNGRIFSESRIFMKFQLNLAVSQSSQVSG